MDTKAETRRAEEAGAEGKEAPALMDAINIRSTALLILTSIAALYFIDWAQPILLPLVVSVLISYALDPLVSLLDAIRVPRPVGAAVVLVAMIGVLAGASVPLQQEATAILDKVPAAVQKLRHDGDARDSEEGMMEKAQKAAKQIEETASQQSARTANVPAGVTPVQIINKPLDIQAYLLQGSPAALVLITQCFSVLLLVYFLLAVGSLYKRKVVRISGPSFGRMRKATRIMNEFHHQVRRFLFVMLLGAIFVGVLTWLAFLMIGMEQAAFWGVLAGVASAIPYLGPFLVLIGCSIAAFIQFGGMDMAVIVGGTSLIITSIQGYLLTPWLTSQVSSLNAVAIFIGLLVWGWLWGPVGLIIATPLLMIVKTLCDHVINLRPFGELLGK
ncbi:AI-2E family transporter [Marinobacter mangrovi]|uniref:AI-2E family transporter n=1 Tax=Marinobacter mangrovi TaxID=2803918 RepID=UPI00193158F3|nr:AI-2E family transporter [Marinobacter mangrovi]